MSLIHTKSHDEPTFNCGSRLQQWGDPGEGIVLDGWRTQPNGDRTCSYCGSLHVDDFHSILKHYGEGEAGYSFSTTDKRYKWYAHRPGVSNASEGGIKFYGWHLPEPTPSDLADAYRSAHAKYVLHITSTFGRPN